jgi:catechol 2,3-dioxygenase-like lactoylglutathione lyase family enzyme
MATEGVLGFHHATAFASDAQRNVAFYVGVLGLRLVKRSVNQDAPEVYHLFYADAVGSPGTDITFFPWRNIASPQEGARLVRETWLAAPAASLISGGIIFSYGMLMRWRFYSGRDPGATNLWATGFGAAMMDGVGGYQFTPGASYFGSAPARFCGQGGTQADRFAPSYTFAQIARPAEVAVIADALGFDYGMTCRNRYPAPADALDASSPYRGLNFAGRYAYEGERLYQGVPYRLGVGAVGFADGHVAGMRTERLFTIFTTASGVPAYRYQYAGE